MANDDELDELLAAMERRAERLQVPGKRAVQMTDSFGVMPSALSETRAKSLIKKGDAIGENYEVERVLTERATSTVVVARHRFVERLFTIKLLPTELGADEATVARFKDEARATSMIGHENIVFITDFGHSNRFGFYYVMEYLDGETLEARIAREGRLSTPAALEVALSAGSALAAVHELGIVHRDVRPKTLMSHKGDSSETWKLLDFGLSSKVVAAHDAITLYEDPRYVAPEVAAGDEPTAQADQFSLSAVLYHALFGHAPWPNRSWTTATAERWTQPRPANDLLDEVGPFLHQTLVKAMAPAPTSRYPSIDAFVSALQRSSGHSRRATIPPIDMGEAARALKGYDAAASVTIGTTFESEVSETSEGGEVEFDDPPSVEISLDMLTSARPKITMEFQEPARLRREWRRNLVTGGLFVPTEKELAPKTPIVVVIRYSPTGADATFAAHVVQFVRENPTGLAVQIAADAQDELHRFVLGLDLGILDPQATIVPLRALTIDADLTSDEAFLLSRLPEPTPVGRLRGMFASLPMDLDDIIARLEQKGWVRVDGGRQRLASQGGTRSEGTDREEFVRLTLQRADFFRSQGNFLAETQTLELAADRYPEEPEFHYRIALSRVQFLNDVPGAIAAMRAAVNAAPSVPKYAKALAELERLAPGL